MSQSVLITGAAAGIGRATLERFAREGWSVIGTARSETSAAELRADLKTASLEAQILAVDLLDRDATDDAVRKVLKDRTPDVIVNNAGVGAFGPVELTSDDILDTVIETNVVAPFRLIRAFVPHFRERRNGVIVNVSSGLGFAADAGQGVYSASKHALEGLSEALSHELRAFDVRVAVVEPGLTGTDIRSKTAVSPCYGPDSPYWEPINVRLDRLGATVWKDGWAEEPSVVADAIFAAAVNPDSPLFIPVGRDTLLSARLRGRQDLGTYEQRTDAALAAWA